MEIESSAYANFLSPYKTLLSFMRYALAPGLLVITTLVTSLVIGIGVRERRTEIAVLKVLGFRPWMVLGLVLGEALLIGTLSGFMATAVAFSLVNALGGIPLPIGFFGRFFIPENALWWGAAVGGMTALIGSNSPLDLSVPDQGVAGVQSRDVSCGRVLAEARKGRFLTTDHAARPTRNHLF